MLLKPALVIPFGYTFDNLPGSSIPVWWDFKGVYIYPIARLKVTDSFGNSSEKVKYTIYDFSKSSNFDLKITGEVIEDLPGDCIQISKDFVEYIELKFDYLREYRKEYKQTLSSRLKETRDKLNKQEQELIAVHWVK